MRIEEYSSLESNIKIAKAAENNIRTTSTMSSVLMLLMELKDVLFKDGKYVKLKWHHFKRIWTVAKAAVTLVNTLLGIFGQKQDKTDWDETKPRAHTLSQDKTKGRKIGTPLRCPSSLEKTSN